jgi:hypothetical protein
MNSNSQSPEAAPEEESTFSFVRSRFPTFLSEKFDLLQILRDSLQLIRDGWRDLLFIFVALQAPLIIVSQLVLPSEPEAVAATEAASRFFPTLIFFYFIGLFITVNVLTASRYIILGAPKPLHDVFLHSVVKFPISVIAAIGVWGIVVLASFPAIAVVAGTGFGGVGILLFLILLVPAIATLVYASLFLHSITLGDRGVLTGLLHGYSLVKGNWWRTFALYMVIAALTLPIVLPLSFFSYIFEPGLAVRLLVKLVLGIIGLISTIPTVIYYYNLLGIKDERIGSVRAGN